MAGSDAALERVRAICLALPDTKETLTWGKPHFRVGEKIFCGFGDEGGGASIGFKLEADHAAAIVAEPGFTRAPYVGHKGWVSLEAARVRDWTRVAALIAESYRLIAPKRSLAKLSAAPPAAARKPAPRKAPARKAPSTKATKAPSAAKPARAAKTPRPRR